MRRKLFWIGLPIAATVLISALYFKHRMKNLKYWVFDPQDVIGI